jgi:SAM-dependent methyltransferase
MFFTKKNKKKAIEEEKIFLENDGYCPICEQNVKFLSKQEWLRDHYFCQNCGSIPRERALMEMIKKHYPDWKEAMIHESSPAWGASNRLRAECEKYTPSQYFQGHQPGEIVNGVRCENLEALTFADASIDLHITQDVMEHVFNPSKAFVEIARTLTPGGMHIFTVPLVNKWNPSQRRAKIDPEGNVTHIAEPSYHGNPLDEGKSLVTFDWGFDICDYIFQSSGLFTQMIYIDDISKGIRAEYIEVLVSHKPLAKQFN